MFLRESVPAFSAREVFENLRGKEGFGEFFYKEAAPTRATCATRPTRSRKIWSASSSSIPRPRR